MATCGRVQTLLNTFRYNLFNLRFSGHPYHMLMDMAQSVVAFFQLYREVQANECSLALFQSKSQQPPKTLLDQLPFCRSDIISCVLLVQDRYGGDIWKSKILPRMKEIVLYSLASAQESIISRKNSHELYGYDFMVDENLNSWLLEINCSPSLEHSTVITTNLVKKMVSDLMKV